MANEPTDYSDFDFGFTAVDAEELEAGEHVLAESQTEIANEVASTVSTALIDRMEGLEDKIGSILIAVQNTESEDFSVGDTDLSRIEEKIDRIVALETDELGQMIQSQGSDIRAIIDEIEERKVQLESEYKTKMEDVENLILPLLYNLLKNPTKEYILWPNRTEVIQRQIDKIVKVTRT
tara:strand:- start:398 stop:934 length:537 start_codon:yes stop_codon:yes gene_type:complete